MPAACLRHQTGGFTLVELLAVLAVIAVLLELYLPAAQVSREAANGAAVQRALAAYTGAAERHIEAGGRTPADLNGLFGICARDPRCAEVANGQVTAHGHRFHWDAEAARLEVWPEYPGLTGSSVLLQRIGEARPQVVLYPDAERLRKRAMRSLIEQLLEQVGDALDRQQGLGVLDEGLPDPCASGHLRCDGTIRASVLFVDGGRGLVAPDMTPEQEDFVARALATMRDTLKIGAGGEDPNDWLLPGLDVSGIDPTPFLFDYAVLRDLQASWVRDRVPRQLLRETLRDARRAERRGDAVAEAAALDAYDAMLDAGVLAWVQRRHARTMQRLTDVLRD